MPPSKNRAVHKWDIFWADLEPVVGREQAGKCRPVLVVSGDIQNKWSDVVTVLPLTKLEGKGREPKSFEVVLPKCVARNNHTTLALPNQIRSIDKSRLAEFAGRLEDVNAQGDVEDKILDHLDILME